MKYLKVSSNPYCKVLKYGNILNTLHYNIEIAVMGK